MSVELIVPRLGESITEAIIAKWLKPVGAPVAVDEPVAELETDKVTVALPAPAAGILSEQRHPEGTTVRVGDAIGAIDPQGIQAQAVSASPAPVAAPPAPAAPEQRPTAVAPAPVSAPPAPVSAPPAPVSAPPAPVSAPPAPASRPVATPTQRRALREHGMPPAAPVQITAPPPPAPAQAAADEEVVPMSPLRRRIAERLVQAQHTAAILTTFNEADMTEIMALRARFQDEFTKKHGVKLGFMSFFVRACVESLKLFPGLNAELRGSDIIYKKHYDFGIAVGSGRGLVVPVVRGVDRLGLGDIEREIAQLAQKAKDSKLTLEDLSGGTFSITNGGIYGSMMSTPLLNMPQTGILGMHNIIRRPVAVGEQVQIRPMMYLALSYDHRVADGREAVQFLVGVKERLEQPHKLLLSI